MTGAVMSGRCDIKLPRLGVARVRDVREVDSSEPAAAAEAVGVVAAVPAADAAVGVGILTAADEEVVEMRGAKPPETEGGAPALPTAAALVVVVAAAEAAEAGRGGAPATDARVEGVRPISTKMSSSIKSSSVSEGMRRNRVVLGLALPPATAVEVEAAEVEGAEAGAGFAASAVVRAETGVAPPLTATAAPPPDAEGVVEVAEAEAEAEERAALLAVEERKEEEEEEEEVAVVARRRAVYRSIRFSHCERDGLGLLPLPLLRCELTAVVPRRTLPPPLLPPLAPSLLRTLRLLLRPRPVCCSCFEAAEAEAAVDGSTRVTRACSLRNQSNFSSMLSEGLPNSTAAGPCAMRARSRAASSALAT